MTSLPLRYFEMIFTAHILPVARSSHLRTTAKLPEPRISSSMRYLAENEPVDLSGFSIFWNDIERLLRVAAGASSTLAALFTPHAAPIASSNRRVLVPGEALFATVLLRMWGLTGPGTLGLAGQSNLQPRRPRGEAKLLRGGRPRASRAP